jgi:hypothetical protein
MNHYIRLSTAAFLLLFCSFVCAAQDEGYWRAASSTAKAITGDIGLANDKLTINYLNFTVAPIRKLKPAEVAAAFDADVNTAGNGSLYRLNVSPGQRFLHHNTLCGSDPTQWMATYVSGRSLQVAFFSGEDMPVFTVDALANTTQVCGTFSYVR